MRAEPHTRTRRRTRAAVIALWVVAVTGIMAGRPQPPRSVPAPASITGRLFDATTGQPIGGALIVLRDLASRDQRMVNTDAAGVFVIANLPAAAYSLHASALGYVGRAHGQRHLFEDGTPLALQAGETRRQVDVALLPGGAIAGRVTRGGQPVGMTDVEALRPRLENDARMLVSVGSAETDEQGQFRIAGLPPGHYYVAAFDPEDAGTPDAQGRMSWTQTFYPGAATPAAAERLRLVAGGSLSDVDVSLLPVTRVTVRGRLVNPANSELASGSVNMSPESEEGLGLGTTRAAVVRPDGTFEFLNVPPGAYRLRGSARTVRPGPALFASFRLMVGDRDISNAVLSLNPGASLFGQVEIADSAGTPPPVLAELWVSAPPADGTTGSGLTRSRVAADGNFSLATPEGTRVIRLEALPAPWALDAVLYQGRDVIDVPFELRSGERRERIRLVLTDRASRIVGFTRDEDGNAVADRAIVALPVNPAFWHAGNRHVRVTYPDPSGRYEIIGLPAGGYRVAAVAGVGQADLYSAAVFEEIAAAGAEALVEAGETTSLDLVLALGGNGR